MFFIPWRVDLNMGSDQKVVPIRGRRETHNNKNMDPRTLTADCWNRFHDLIQEIPDPGLREEALDFWRKKLPSIVSLS